MSVERSREIFLVNDKCRAIRIVYDPEQRKEDKKYGYSLPDHPTVFKTLDPGIAVGDYVVCQTGVRHGMTVFRVTEVDIDFDLRGSTPIPWIIDTVDVKTFESIRDRETAMVGKLSTLRLAKERRELAEEYSNGFGDEFQALVDLTK